MVLNATQIGQLFSDLATILPSNQVLNVQNDAFPCPSIVLRF